MPLYEYRCTDCDTAFEMLVREQTRLACPSCEGTHLEKQLSAFAVGAAARTPTRRTTGPGPCGACGDPRGPGSCAIN